MLYLQRTNRLLHRVGDRVGVGAQSSSCLQPDCAECSDGHENHCTKSTNTYGDNFKDGSGKSYGGYADYSRVPSHFVFKIPDEISSAQVAPMLCGGITVFSPLKRNGAGPGTKVGIVGIGGLGHFGLLYAKVCNMILTARLLRILIVSLARLLDARKLSLSVVRALRNQTL